MKEAPCPNLDAQTLASIRIEAQIKGGVLANPAFGPAERNGGGSAVLPEGSRLLGAWPRMLGPCSEFSEKMLRNSGPWIRNLDLGQVIWGLAQTVESFGSAIWGLD